MILNSLTPGKFAWNFRYVIFKWILVVDGWGISCKIALILMSLDFADDQSTLVQVIAWCRQATSHYLRQCWSRSLSPYGVTRPQWVNWQQSIIGSDNGLAPNRQQSHYLNQWWYSLLTHLSITRSQWVKQKLIFDCYIWLSKYQFYFYENVLENS